MTEIDVTLIDGCRRQNPVAQQTVYNKCYGWMMGVCSRYILNELDRKSMVNDAFYKIFKAIDTYNIEIPFNVWARKILINCVIDNYRKTQQYQKQTKYFEEDVLTRYSGVEDDIFEKYEAEYLIKIINELPPATKTVFNLFAIDGYTHDEICKMLKISLGTSK